MITTKTKYTFKKLITIPLALAITLTFALIGLGGAAQTQTADAAQPIAQQYERIYADSGLELYFPGSQEIEAHGITPFGGSPINFWNERVYFSRRTQGGYVIRDATPIWRSPYSCGITAGASALGFYNRQFSGFIPNQVAGRYILGRWSWNGSGDGARVLFSDLFRRMNATHQGVTMNGYLDGLRSYTASRGRNISLLTTRTGSNQLNIAALSAAFRRGEIVSLFMAGFSIVTLDSIVTSANHDTIFHNSHAGNHIMVAYGYRNIRYYNAANQLIRNDVYLYVHSGLDVIGSRALVPLHIGYVSNAFITRVF